MGAGTFIRSAGSHVAERIRPAAGTPEESDLAALAADPASDWQHIADPEPEPAGPPARPPQSAPVADWRAWAVACGAGEVAADLLTKPQLIEQYGKGGDA